MHFKKQISLEDEIDKFKESKKPKIFDKKQKKTQTLENALGLLRGRQKRFNGFQSKIFPIEKQTQGK